MKPGPLARCLRLAALLAALALGGVAALVGWGLYANQRAADAARDFCAASPVGSAAAEVTARAEAAGLRQGPTREPEGRDFYFQGWVFNAAVCHIDIQKGRVAATATRMEGD